MSRIRSIEHKEYTLLELANELEFRTDREHDCYMKLRHIKDAMGIKHIGSRGREKVYSWGDCYKISYELLREKAIQIGAPNVADPVRPAFKSMVERNQREQSATTSAQDIQPAVDPNNGITSKMFRDAAFRWCCVMWPEEAKDKKERKAAAERDPITKPEIGDYTRKLISMVYDQMRRDGITVPFKTDSNGSPVDWVTGHGKLQNAMSTLDWYTKEKQDSTYIELDKYVADKRRNLRLAARQQK